MNAERAFEQLAHRAPTVEELERLRRVKDALGLADNDALWSVLLALEHYRALYEDIPRQVAAAGQTAVETSRLAFEAAARAQTASSHRALAEAVVATSLRLAQRQGEALRWRSWALVTASLVGFGSLCAIVGQALSGRLAALRGGNVGERVLATLLGLPAGWILLVLLLPAAAAAAHDGWRSIRQPGATTGDRTLGWTTIAVGAAGIVAAVALLARLL